jgi:hypothetical protein
VARGTARQATRVSKFKIIGPQLSPPPPQPHPLLLVFGGQPRQRGRAMQTTRVAPTAPPVQTHGWSIATRYNPRRPGAVRFGVVRAAVGVYQGMPGWRITEGDQPRRRGRATSLACAPAAYKAPVYDLPRCGLMARRSAEAHGIARRCGLGWCWTAIPVSTTTDVGYHIYSNTGVGDPINYSVPIGTNLGYSDVTWTSSRLAYPGVWSFGVRAFNQYGDEQNIDAVVTINLDAAGQDITNQPNSPIGLRAFALAGGAIRIEWTSTTNVPSAKLPTGFNVYIGTSGVPDYTSAVAKVAYNSSLASSFVANLSGLTNGTTYTIGVRAYNATAEEQNTSTVSCAGDSVGPSAVQNLAAIATSSA